MKTLTITVSDEFFEGLSRRLGDREAGPLLESLTRNYVLPKSLDDHYREAAQDEDAEREAVEWIGSNGGEALPDEDWSWLRDAERRGLVGSLRPGHGRGDQEDQARRDRLE